MKLFKEKCDGCGVSLNPDNHTVVKFRATEEDTGKVYDNEMKLCPDCAERLEEVIQESVAKGEGKEVNEPF